MGMRIGLLLLLIALASPAQLKQRTAPPSQPSGPMVDEDEDLLPQTEYAFNPIQAKKELKVGDFYRRKNNQRAAAVRYLEATRWNPGYAEAFWKLAETRDELDQHAEALDAYSRFVQLAEQDSKAEQARRRIAAIEAELASPPVSAGKAASAP